jgi:hypothetical protein
MFHRMLVVALLGLLSGLAGCNNCDALAQTICEDLGAEDCALWKEAKGADGLANGRRRERQCFNARFAPGAYSPYLQGAQNTAAVMKTVKAKQAGH